MVEQKRKVTREMNSFHEDINVLMAANTTITVKTIKFGLLASP
jgi:hypothetical protein